MFISTAEQLTFVNMSRLDKNYCLGSFHCIEDTKLYIPSTINILKRCSPKPFGQTKNGLVSGRLACTSSKTEILNKIGM